MRCTNGHSVPQNAAYCPQCGAHAAPFNAALISDLDERSELDLDIPMTIPRRHNGLVMLLAGALMATAGVAYLWMGSSNAPAPEVAAVTESAPVAVGAAPQTEKKIAYIDTKLTVDNSAAVSTLAYDGRPLVDIRTAQGSRYETNNERVKAIELRVRHAWQTSAASQAAPSFTARANGSIYEVVWSRADGEPFRVLDVTPQDVRLWEKQNGKTSTAILAHLIADRLTSMIDARPNS